MLDATGFKIITKVLKHHQTILQLDLGHNKLGVQGAILFADCLRENCVLQSVNLEWNGISTEGFIAIVNALTSNKRSALTTLDVHSNQIGPDGAIVCHFNYKINSLL